MPFGSGRPGAGSPPAARPAAPLEKTAFGSRRKAGFYDPPGGLACGRSTHFSGRAAFAFPCFKKLMLSEGRPGRVWGRQPESRVEEEAGGSAGPAIRAWLRTSSPGHGSGGSGHHRPRSLVSLQGFPLSPLEKAAAPAGRGAGGGWDRPGHPTPPATARALLGIVGDLHVRWGRDGRVGVPGRGVIRVQLPVGGVQRLVGRGWGHAAAPHPTGQGGLARTSPGFCCVAGLYPGPAAARAGRCGPCRWASAAGDGHGAEAGLPLCPTSQGFHLCGTGPPRQLRGAPSPQTTALVVPGTPMCRRPPA